MTRTQIQIEFTHPPGSALLEQFEDQIYTFLDEAGAVDIEFEVTDSERL